MSGKVWILFRHSQIFPFGLATVVDKAAEWVTGGSEVHCECALNIDGTLTTYGSLWGIGVFSSEVSRDCSYQKGTWTWVDASALFSSPSDVRNLHSWLERTLGCSYNVRAMFGIAVPWLSRVTVTLPKHEYLCSELLGDALLNCSSTSSTARKFRTALVQACGGRTSTLSPYQLSGLLRDTGVCCECSAAAVGQINATHKRL